MAAGSRKESEMELLIFVGLLVLLDVLSLAFAADSRHLAGHDW